MRSLRLENTASQCTSRQREGSHAVKFTALPIMDADGAGPNLGTNKIGDARRRAAHWPVHSRDTTSFCRTASRVKFGGYAPHKIASRNANHEAKFLTASQNLYTRDNRRLSLGHGPPRTESCDRRLREAQWTAAGGRLTTWKSPHVSTRSGDSVVKAIAIRRSNEKWQGKQSIEGGEL